MTGWSVPVAAAAAGVGCGMLNALVGGGTLVSFPVLMALGVPPVAANATNTVALGPGYLSAAVAQRKDLAQQSDRFRSLLLPVAIGGGLGAGMLLVVSDAVFRVLVPVLLAIATASLALAPRLRALLGRTADHSSTIPDARWLPLALGTVAVYGGFFGAGIGIMLLAVLSVGVHQTLTSSNALKQTLSLVINLTAAVLLVTVGPSAGVLVRWGLAAPLALGNVIGGQLGGQLSRHIDPDRLRVLVITIGSILTLVYVAKEYA